MRLLAPCLLAALLTGASARASEPAPEDGARARRVALAREGVAASGQAEGLKLLLRQEVESHIELMRAANNGISDAYLAELREEMLGLVVAGLEAKDGLLDRIAAMQADYYTEDELVAMRDFYASPLGRKMKRLTPELAGKGAELGRRWAEAEVPKFQERLKQRLKAKGLAVPEEKRSE